MRKLFGENTTQINKTTQQSCTGCCGDWRLLRAGKRLVFCSSHGANGTAFAVFPACRTLGMLLGVPQGILGSFALCTTQLRSSAGGAVGLRAAMSQHTTFLSLRAHLQHKHSISPSQGMPLKSSLLLKVGFDTKLKNVKHRGQKLHSFSDYPFFRRDKQLSFLLLFSFFAIQVSDL